MSNGFHSYGSTIFNAPYGTVAPAATLPVGGAYTEVAEVKKINGVALESSDTDLTYLNSPDKAKEFMAGFMDAGTATFTVNCTTAGLTALTGDLPAGGAGGKSVSNLSWLVVIGTKAFFWFDGYLKSMPTDIPDDGPVTIDITLKISGKPTLYLIA